MSCQAFEQFPIGFGEQHIFVDWDEDDDLDVIRSNLEGRTCPSQSELCGGSRKRNTEAFKTKTM